MLAILPVRLMLPLQIELVLCQSHFVVKADVARIHPHSNKYFQPLHLGFQTLKVQKHATQIHDDLKNITSRFVKHFDGIKNLRKKLEDAMKVTDDFGRDARSITRTLENIGDPEQIEKAAKEENVEKVDFKDKTNVS